MNLTFLSPAGHCRSRSSTSLQFSLSAIFKKLIHTYIHTYISNDSNIAIKHLRREQRSAIKLKIWKITELLKQSCWGLQFCVENYITMLQISYVGQRMIFTICVGLEGGGHISTGMKKVVLALIQRQMLLSRCIMCMIQDHCYVLKSAAALVSTISSVLFLSSVKFHTHTEQKVNYGFVYCNLCL